ncbi:Helix-turn-helix domain-containing protein [Prauserella aidingensis]|uniref:helix-turn-helix domain-containing protein n=1 Tax=Prauserella aidingensis TaxID=387890 RepID=UPI003FD6C63B|nr:Helix-turn-helix domain-containing protein [Prauserella aidingensis]
MPAPRWRLLHRPVRRRTGAPAPSGSGVGAGRRVVGVAIRAPMGVRRGRAHPGMKVAAFSELVLQPQPTGLFFQLAQPRSLRREHLGLGVVTPLGVARVFWVCEIARQVGRVPSTVSRELRRNAVTSDRPAGLSGRGGAVEGPTGREATAGRQASHQSTAAGLRRAEAGRRCHRRRWPSGRRPERFRGWGVMAGAGRTDGGRGVAWRPEQISNRLKVDFPEGESMRISHEKIVAPALEFLSSKLTYRR